MRVVLLVRNDERVVRQLVVCQVRCELGKRNEVVCLRLSVEHVRDVSERIVSLHIRILIATRVSNRRQTLRVRFPRLTGRVELSNYVVDADCAGEGIVIRDLLTGC